MAGCRLKKCLGGCFETATEARPTRHGDDKPGLARSGRRAGSVFHAHGIRWGQPPKVPGVMRAFPQKSAIRTTGASNGPKATILEVTLRSMPFLDGPRIFASARPTLGACLSNPREPRWLGEGADARRAARFVVGTTDKAAQRRRRPSASQPAGSGQISPQASLSPPHWVLTQLRRLRLA